MAGVFEFAGLKRGELLIYTVTLNPALDYIMKLEKLHFDDINRTNGEEISYGGKGINVSAILSRLGISSIALGFQAGFTGDWLSQLLEKDGIQADLIKLRNGSTRINVKLRAEAELDINARGPEVQEDEIEAFLEKTDKMKSGDILVLAGSVPENLPDDIYEKILSKTADKDVYSVVDAQGHLLLNTLKYKPFLIKPNHLELEELFGVKMSGEEEIIRYAKRLREMGALNVLVSRGGDGAVLVDESGCVHSIGVIRGRLVNSACCGDAMVAGFIAGYMKTKDYSYALKLGAACANATAFCYGLADKNSIMELFEKL